MKMYLVTKFFCYSFSIAYVFTFGIFDRQIYGLLVLRSVSHENIYYIIASDS